MLCTCFHFSVELLSMGKNVHKFSLPADTELKKHFIPLLIKTVQRPSVSVSFNLHSMLKQNRKVLLHRLLKLSKFTALQHFPSGIYPKSVGSVTFNAQVIRLKSKIILDGRKWVTNKSSKVSNVRTEDNKAVKTESKVQDVNQLAIPVIGKPKSISSKYTLHSWLIGWLIILGLTAL